VTTLAALGLLAVVQTASANTQQPTDSLQTEHVVGELGAKLDSQLTRYVADKGGFSGTVLVVRDRRIVLLKGYGLANIETNTPNTPATRFEMNSMTKMLTAASILQLAAAGRLQLDAPVERYLGAFPASKRGATVEQLAMHTSGLIVAGAPLAGETRDAFVADAKRTMRESPPGAKYRYTNAGYSLLAAIIEHVSGTSYECYLKKNAFAPAAMSTAIFRDEVPSANPLFALGYVGDAAGAPKPGPPNPYVWGTRGAGGVWSTVGDMYRWLVAVEDSVVVGGNLRLVLLSPPGPPSLEAFGWHVRPATDSTRALIDKGGGSADFASQLLFFPRERVAIIWASNNLTRRWRQTLNRAIPDLVFLGATKAPAPRVGGQ
jgi:CubicO group peptidase (beta-lactamase class C family)